MESSWSNFYPLTSQILTSQTKFTSNFDFPDKICRDDASFLPEQADKPVRVNLSRHNHGVSLRERQFVTVFANVRIQSLHIPDIKNVIQNNVKNINVLIFMCLYVNKILSSTDCNSMNHQITIHDIYISDYFGELSL